MRTVDLGTNGKLNLETISELVETELQLRAGEMGDGFEIGDVKPLEVISGKGYSAKGQAAITYQGEPLGRGTLYTVLFRPGDGTGDRGSFKIDKLKAAWTPRIKEDYAELCIAIGTGCQNKWLPGLIGLTEFSTDINNPTKKFSLPIDLTCPVGVLNYYLINPGSKRPRAGRFAFTLHKEREIGNPHAIAFPSPLPNYMLKKGSALFQVGAFLGFPERTDELKLIEDLVYRSNL